MTATAADVMETHVVSVGPSTPLSSVYRTFFDEGISGAPVVDDTGRLLGVISTSDVLRVLHDEEETAEVGGSYFSEGVDAVPFGGLELGEEFRARMGELTVEDAMTTDPVVVEAGTPVPEIARLLREQRIHRVLVTSGDTLEGIVSAFDLIRLLEKG